MHYIFILMILWISLINVTAYPSARNFSNEKKRTKSNRKYLNTNTPVPNIYGGRDAEDGEIPYVVSVQYDVGTHFCGGSIISETYVLTAAHCVCPGMLGTVQVALGSIYLFDFYSQRIEVTDAICHPGYNEETLNDDIAVLKLKTSIMLAGYISKINVAKETPGEIQCTVSGWGKTETTARPSTLKVVTVRIVNMNTCMDSYGGLDPQTMICAADDRKDACQGDSGGPMVCDGKLVGVVSFGNGCAQRDYPGVYTNVAHYREWISNITNSNKIPQFDKKKISLLLSFTICIHQGYLYQY